MTTVSIFVDESGEQGFQSKYWPIGTFVVL